ncbi:hypothetical protein [Paenibacillus sp. FSL E2-0178]|uniref:hypothetical protein n=1 Tax=Paenibacillus sp. FSL E2-0178 TaxID=2921361 RepID=UPI0031592323
MDVNHFIETTIKNLESKGHREIQFLSAQNCTLVKNGVLETYLIEHTNLDSHYYEINLNEIEPGIEIKGSKIRIYSIPKGKRKGITANYNIALKANKN